jgi:hypothetical protein
VSQTLARDDSVALLDVAPPKLTVAATILEVVSGSSATAASAAR